MAGGRFNTQAPFVKQIEEKAAVIEDKFTDATDRAVAKGVSNAVRGKNVASAVASFRERFGGAFISTKLSEDTLGKVAGSKTFGAYMQRQIKEGGDFDRLSHEIKKISLLSSSTHGGYTWLRTQLQAERREVKTRLNNNMENQEAFARFLATKGDKYDGDVQKAQADFEEWNKSQRRGMSDERLKRRLWGLAVHAAAAPVEATLSHVPVVGQAVNSAFNHAATAKFMGASWKGAGAIGLLAGAGQGLGSLVQEGWQGAVTEEQMVRHFGQMSDPRTARRLIGGMRSMGFSNAEMSSLGGLGRAQGDFQGIDTLAKLDLAYGIGHQGIGALGAMSRSGMQGDNTNVIKEAVASGVVQGLKPGRFGEVLQGLSAILSHTSIGVQAEGGHGINMLAAALGKNPELSGANAYSVISSMDAGIRGGSNPLSQSMAFISAHDVLGGKGSYWEIEKEMDKGIQGKGNLQRVKALMGRLAQSSGVNQPGATADNQQMFEMLIKNQFGVGANAAEKIAATFNGGKIDEATLEKELAAAKPKQEQAYDAMVDQASTMRSIDVKVEAIRAKMGAGFVHGVAAGTVGGILNVMGGSDAGNPYARFGGTLDKNLIDKNNFFGGWATAGGSHRRSLLGTRAAAFEHTDEVTRATLAMGTTNLPDALMSRVTSQTHPDIDDADELQKVAAAARDLIENPRSAHTVERVERDLSLKQLQLLDQLLQRLASIDQNTAEALLRGDATPFMSFSPLDMATGARNARTALNQSVHTP